MAKPVNLLKLNESKLKQFLDSFDHVFSDCDGVIWAKTPIPGSGDFIELMKRLGKTVHFVSNNSIRSRKNYEDLFNAANIKSGYENLTVPSMAIAEFLKSKNFDKSVFCATCPQTKEILKEHGLKCKDGPDMGAEFYTEYHQYLEDDEEIGAVVFDSDFKINVPKMYKAITYLSRPDVIFINGASDKYVPLKPGSLSLGTGIFTEIVATEAKREPIQLGKPGKMFGEFAMKRAGVTNPGRVLFIGDMIEQDVGLGRASGFQTLLVLTNISQDEMMAHPTIKPDYYAPSLGSLVPLFIGKRADESPDGKWFSPPMNICKTGGIAVALPTDKQTVYTACKLALQLQPNTSK